LLNPDETEALVLFTQTQESELHVRLNVGDEEVGSRNVAVDYGQPIRLA